MKKLPDNNFGYAVMLIAVVLAFLLPFVLTLWVVSLLAPLWVSIPTALAVGIGVGIALVTFPNTD